MALRALAVLLAACLAAGCGGGGDSGGTSGADTTAPTISLPSIDPGTVPAAGGTVTLRVTVTDPSGVAWVRATVTPTGGASDIRELTLQAGGYYQMSYTVPANMSGSYYTVTVTAADARGNLSQPVSAGNIGVGSDTGPPPPPAM